MPRQPAVETTDAQSRVREQRHAVRAGRNAVPLRGGGAEVLPLVGAEIDVGGIASARASRAIAAGAGAVTVIAQQRNSEP